MKTRRVVVTGMGVQSPCGDSLVTQREAILSGTPYFTKKKNPIISDDAYMVVGECPHLDVRKLPDRKVQKVTTRKDIIGLLAAFESLKDAGIEKGTIDPERIGIYTGVPSTYIDDLQPYYELLLAKSVSGVVDVHQFGANLLGNVNPMVMMQTLMNNILCYVSIPLDIRGVNANFVDFHISGLKALGEAFYAIKENRADVVVAGGVSAGIDIYHAHEGIELGYLYAHAKEDDLDLDPVRPYDRGRKGTVLSESGAFCVLESLDSALARKAKIYGEVLGYVENSESAFHYADQGSLEGFVDCFDTLEHLFGIDRKSLSCLYGHGNGSISGDLLELQAYRKIFANIDHHIPLLSIKGVTGETSEASGVLATIDALVSLAEGVVPGNHNLEEVAHPGDGTIYLPQVTENISKGPIVVTARSFAGANAVLGITSYP